MRGLGYPRSKGERSVRGLSPKPQIRKPVAMLRVRVSGLGFRVACGISGTGSRDEDSYPLKVPL